MKYFKVLVSVALLMVSFQFTKASPLKPDESLTVLQIRLPPPPPHPPLPFQRRHRYHRHYRHYHRHHRGLRIHLPPPPPRPPLPPRP